MARRSRDAFDEHDYVDVRVRDREDDRDRDRGRDRDPLARYFQEDRRSDTGALVLRQREVETVERSRPRGRSPSPVRYREVIRERSPSPFPPAREVDRVEVRDRERYQYREPSRGPQERIVTRVIDRERKRSPTPSPEREHDRIRIVERSRSRAPSVSPSPSPPPVEQRQLVRGPVVEREVITHYTDVDHGVIYAPRAPPPRPEPRRERDTEIDIYSSRHRTEVDIDERDRRRPRSRSRVRVAPARASDREVTVRSDRNFLEVDVDAQRPRRSRSAQPPARERQSGAVAEEARYIETRIDERGRMGEAYNGATRDWTIVDVPPGTEHVRMDGVGGASADITWQRYNGVRRTRFIPEREEDVVVAPRRRPQEAPRERVRERSRSEHINVQIIDDNRGHGRSRGHEVDVETDRRPVRSTTRAELMPAPASDMWTEITKDLVSREAIDYLGYDYQETEYFYYILQYLRYEDVQELVQLSDRIRRQRRRGAREEVDIEVDVSHGRHRSHSAHHPPRRSDERVYEHEVVVDRLHPGRYR